MRCKYITRAILIFACCAAAALGAGFRWTNGAYPDYDWNVCGNWFTVSQNPCYPATIRDDATVPAEVGDAWRIDLVDEDIDDMTILGDVEFWAAESFPTLSVDSLTIGGGVTASVKAASTITTVPS